MPNTVEKPTDCMPLELVKEGWLKSLGLLGDKSVLDCDPIARTVTFEDGRVRQVTEVYTRVMGYHRPITFWNAGKQQEHRDRRYFTEGQARTSDPMERKRAACAKYDRPMPIEIDPLELAAASAAPVTLTMPVTRAPSLLTAVSSH